MIDAEQIARLRALEKAATPGPRRLYHAKLRKDFGSMITEVQCDEKVAIIGWMGFDDSFRSKAQHKKNAALIAEARNALPALLDALEAERKRADEATKIARSISDEAIRVRDLAAEQREINDELTTQLDGALAAKEKAEGERDKALALKKEWRDAHGRESRNLADVLGRALKAESERSAALAEIARLKAALTPSAETKIAYMSEFQFPSTIERTYNETVPWTTIKEIMAAICVRAALKGQTDGGR
jgi:hypothetical protein